MDKVKNLLEINRKLCLNKADPYSSLPLGGLSHQQGKIVFLNKELNFNFLAVLFFPKNILRGSHYHQKRSEHLYILQGSLQARFWLPDDMGAQWQGILSEGDLIHVKPGLAHAYRAIESCTAIEFSKNTFDLNDYYYPENPFEGRVVPSPLA